VDDDADFVTMLAKAIRQEGGRVSHCGDLKSAQLALDRETFQLILLDNRLPDGTGYEFFPQLFRRFPDTVVVMMTGVPELAQAVELTRNGLFDYLTKPLNVADVVACLRRVQLRLDHPDGLEVAGEIIGNAPVMRDLLNSIRQIARHREATVLLTGETGTGKDLAARLLHRLTHSSKGDKSPYVPLNCSAVPAEMFESELFGSEKGAFTGADKRREGLIETAANGTLFLDEITEMPLAQQAKLLRFLESREYRPLGTSALQRFSGRIITATNRSLAEEVKRGKFREDLMYRLAVATVQLPALREHLADLDALVENLLAQLGQKYRRKKPFLKPEDIAVLRQYHFPGNVRELRNLLERALLRTPEEAHWLFFDAGWLQGRPEAPNPSADQTAAPPERELNAIDLQEYRLIQQALQAEGGGIRRAATRLGITHQALLRRLEKWPELRLVAPGGSGA
jgi:DNA-binding NtrC family response regulator